MKSTTSLMMPKGNQKETEPTHLTWELPLGTIRGRLDEPGPRFVDPYSKQEREAIQEVEAMPRLTQRSANR